MKLLTAAPIGITLGVITGYIMLHLPHVLACLSP